MPIVEIASEREGDLPDYITDPETAFHCRVRNDGTGPAYLKHWTTAGDSPGGEMEKGRFRLADSDYWADPLLESRIVMVPSNTEISVFTSSSVMIIISDKIEEKCSEESKEATFKFIIHATNNTSISSRFEYTYVEDETGKCTWKSITQVNGE